MSFWRSLIAAIGRQPTQAAANGVAGEPPMKLLVGLGNHGRQYAGTRHNVGYEVIDMLAERFGPVAFRRQFDGKCASVEIAGHRVLLLKPETYMNESGRSVQAALGFYQIPPDSLLVICDDLNLPIGKIRIRRSGSDGGQKGLRSLAQHLGSTDYPRLRVGIGDVVNGEAVRHVLGRFSKDERALIDPALERAVDAVVDWCKAGIESCMNRFN